MLVQQTRSQPSFYESSTNSTLEHTTIKNLPDYHGDISSYEASELLQGKQPGSYLIRWNTSTERFACHVVQRNGHVEERPFSFDDKTQSWKNGGPVRSWQNWESIFEHLIDHQVGIPV